MNYLKKHFSLYAHLPREIYVLAFGKIMTSMGALIWPMMTLIMSEKLGMNGQTIGLYTMLLSLFMGPFYLLGGKLADKYNKKTIIVTFDLIGNSLYLVCAMLPLSMNTLYLLAIASVFQSMEQPAYDALIADLTPYTDRERAYSLNYLAYNLGLVMAPTIGGLLFNNHLNLSFLINGLADLSSTLLILFFIHNLKAVRQEGRPENVYEQGQSSSIFQVLRQRKLFFLLFLIMGAFLPDLQPVQFPHAPAYGAGVPWLRRFEIRYAHQCQRHYRGGGHPYFDQAALSDDRSAGDVSGAVSGIGRACLLHRPGPPLLDCHCGYGGFHHGRNLPVHLPNALHHQADSRNPSGPVLKHLQQLCGLDWRVQQLRCRHFN